MCGPLLGAIIPTIDAHDPDLFDRHDTPQFIDLQTGAVWPQPDLLDLPNMYCWKIVKSKDATIICVETYEPEFTKPSPQCVVAKNGHSGEARFQDFPLHGKQSWVLFKRAKFKCKDCGRAWTETTEQLDQSHRMTSRFRSYVEEKSVQFSFLEAANICSIDRKRVERVFKSYAKRRLKNYTLNLPAMPEVLSVNVGKLMGRPTLIVGDVKARRMFDLAPVSSLEDVTRFLEALACSSVKFLCVDPLADYASDLPLLVKNARPLVGKMPLLKLADKIIEKIRHQKSDGVPDLDPSALSVVYNRSVQSIGLSKDEVRFLKSLHGQPVLRHAYILKRQITDLYDLGTKSDAVEALQILVENASLGGVHCGELRKVIADWRDAILAYFDADRTDVHKLAEYDKATAEVLRGMERVSRGHKFETLRAKLLLRYGIDAGIAFDLMSVPPELHDEMLEAFYSNGVPLEALQRALSSATFEL